MTLKPAIKNKIIDSDDDEPGPVAAKPVPKKGIFAGGSDDSDDFKPKAKPQQQEVEIKSVLKKENLQVKEAAVVGFSPSTV